MSSFLVAEGDSNVEENTWRHGTCPHFSFPKVIPILRRIPEDVIHVLVSHYRRWFEYWWEYLETSWNVRGSPQAAIMVLALSQLNTYHGVTLGLVMWYAQHPFMTCTKTQSYDILADILRNRASIEEVTKYTSRILLRCISKKHLRPGGMAPSEWMRSVRAVRDTPVADYSAPGVNTTRRVAYRPPIAVSPFLLALSVSYFKQTVWRCG